MGFKKEVSKDELMFYLEEMAHMDLADEIEQRFFEDYKWDDWSGVKHRKSELAHILRNYRYYQNVKF